VLIGLACFVAAAVVIWSVLPRFDRFEPPGPEIAEDEQPALFAEIRAIAAATGQQMPVHVYLVAEVNAFVAQRGGLMGFGSRRVMGIGMPLLRALQVDELRAVLAHEMGHFYGGDTRLGPFIYKTRGALARTVVNLGRVGESTEHWIVLLFHAVQAPFRWFLIGFLRVSQAISRAQEYSADAVAVRAEGQRALIDGLKKTHAAALAHSVYMNNEVAPLLARGKLPAIGEGFTRFLANERLTKLLDDAVAQEMEEGRADPYDSHPPLRERIEAAQAVSGSTKPADARRAVDLLRDAEAMEAAGVVARDEARLEAIAWEDTAAEWATIWREDVGEVKAALEGITVAEIPTDLKEIYERVVEAFGSERASSGSDDDFRSWWRQVIGEALALVLIDAGFTATTAPGEPVRLVRGEEVAEPFLEVAKYLAGEEPAEAWRARWEARGLADRELVE
jgi:Zn-dependent protease with chaperone function